MIEPSNPLYPVILFNKMLIELREEYKKKQCPLHRQCIYYDDSCIGNYILCPLYYMCRDARSPAWCIVKHQNPRATHREYHDMLNAFITRELQNGE